MMRARSDKKCVVPRTPEESEVAAMNMLDLVLRMLLALAIGALIGWERELLNRPAGLRTHMLVSIGAAVIMIIGETAAFRYAGAFSVDPTRLAAQVVSGIGFLGAGTILREGVNVRGLTTAASLWAVACLGLAAGGGYYEVAAAGTVAIILTLTIFDQLERRFAKSKSRGYRLTLETTDLPCVIGALNEVSDTHSASLDELQIARVDDADAYEVSVRMMFEKLRKDQDHRVILSHLAVCQGVQRVKAEEYVAS